MPILIGFVTGCLALTLYFSYKDFINEKITKKRFSFIAVCASLAIILAFFTLLIEIQSI